MDSILEHTPQVDRFNAGQTAITGTSGTRPSGLCGHKRSDMSASSDGVNIVPILRTAVIGNGAAFLFRD